MTRDCMRARIVEQGSDLRRSTSRSGTDLKVGLADGHLWLGGERGGQRADCIPNMPTEEVFTTPHKVAWRER